MTVFSDEKRLTVRAEFLQNERGIAQARGEASDKRRRFTKPPIQQWGWFRCDDKAPMVLVDPGVKIDKEV